MSKFNVVKRKLDMEPNNEDFLSHLENKNIISVNSVCTNEDIDNSKLVFAKLFSKAPEMLEMIDAMICVFTNNNNSVIEASLLEKASDLIKQVTEI